MRQLVAGGFTASLLAFLMAVPRIGPVATWKVVLGVIGLLVFGLAEHHPPPTE